MQTDPSSLLLSESLSRGDKKTCQAVSEKKNIDYAEIFPHIMISQPVFPAAYTGTEGERL